MNQGDHFLLVGTLQDCGESSECDGSSQPVGLADRLSTHIEPEVAIIVPCYNAAKTLRDTIESALAQSLCPSEVLVVDDGSTDDSAKIASSFGPPVRVISQVNAGAGSARARGVAAASSEFVSFLDADDTTQPNRLELLTAALVAHPKCVAAFGLTRNATTGCCGAVDTLGAAAGAATVPIENSLRQMLRSGTPLAGAMNLVARRSVADEVCRARPFYRAANDYDLQLRLASRGDFVFVPTVTCNYAPTKGGISGRTQHGLQPALAVCAAFDAAGDAARNASPLDAETYAAMKLRLTASWAFFLPALLAQRQWRAALRLVRLAISEHVVGWPIRNFYWGFRHAIATAAVVGRDEVPSVKHRP